MKESQDAAKDKLGRAAALRLARAARRVVVARGAKRVTFEMQTSPPTDAEILAVILGPTGNLRAPTLRRGGTLVVGFHADAYAEVLG